MATESSSEDVYEKAHGVVKELYEFRNKYFIENGAQSVTQKDDDLKRKLQESVERLDSLKTELDQKDRALYCMLKGKALNVEAEFSSTALELLTKAVKLNPKYCEAWCQLGECYWKKGDLKAAQNCFEGSLKHDKSDKVALRSLSMLLRQIGKSPQEKLTNLLKSLDLGKEALSSDINDGMSWYNVGNAYFSLFFLSSSQDTKILNQCKAAYSKAIADETAALQPDFLFNFAVVLQYQQEFQMSLEYFQKAAALDPSWPDPKQHYSSLRTFLQEMNEMIAKKGSLKPKRIKNMIESFKPNVHLGQYLNKYNIITTKELVMGENKESVFLGKIIGFIPSETLICPFFCAMDECKDCVSVCVHNLNPAKCPKVGDAVAIPSPIVNRINVDHEGLTVSYYNITVGKPSDILINGKHLSPDSVARPQCTFTIKND